MMAISCIKNRQAENQERYRKRDDCVEFEQTHDGHGRQHVAEEGRAGVAHEDLSRVEVVRHKADARASERRHRDGNRHVAGQQCNGKHGNRRDRRNTDRKSVQTVNQVYRIRDADNPDNRGRHCQNARDGQTAYPTADSDW